MMSLRGLYLANVIGTKVCPKEPVPPVTRIVEFESIPYVILAQLMGWFNHAKFTKLEDDSGVFAAPAVHFLGSAALKKAFRQHRIHAGRFGKGGNLQNNDMTVAEGPLKARKFMPPGFPGPIFG